jgi:hypothetical protein
MTDLPDNPFDHGVTPEFIASLSSPVGSTTLNWPFIEHALAQITEATADAVGEAGAKVKREYDFGKRLKYLRRIFSEVAALKSYRARAEQIFDGLDPLAEVRHLLSHGRISRYDAGAKVIDFVRLRPDRSGSHHTFEEVRVFVENIERAARASTRLAADLLALAADLVNEFIKD